MTTDPKWIYESPDGGKTVFKRPFGADVTERVLDYEDPQHKKEKEFFERWHKFRDILELAKNNPRLEKMLHKIEVYYELSK